MCGNFGLLLLASSQADNLKGDDASLNGLDLLQLMVILKAMAAGIVSSPSLAKHSYQTLWHSNR
jgi:hypothetical protein